MASTICIHGRQYPVIHNKLDESHDYSKTFYQYRENNKTYTCYTIEFTTNQVVFDKIGGIDFDFDWYDVLQFDNIDDAIKAFVKLRYREDVLFLHMFMDVYHNGELILSECKDSSMYSIADKPTLKRLENAENAATAYKEKYERLQKFVDMYGIDDREIDRRLKGGLNHE